MRCVAGLSAIPPIKLTAPIGINREQQVMQQNQKLGTQPGLPSRLASSGSMLQGKFFFASEEPFRGFATGTGKEKRPGEPGHWYFEAGVVAYEPFGLISA
jgi:hypothetical protein